MTYALVAIAAAAGGGLLVWLVARSRIATLEASLRAASELRDTVRALSAEAVESGLARLKAEAERTDADRRQALEQMMRPIKESLERVDAQGRQLENARKEAYGGLLAQVRMLNENQERLRSETGNLVTALRNPAARGRWGEMQLRRVAEVAGMLPHCDFTEQTTVTADDRRLRPDLVVRLPGSKNVVVDAKVPLEAYLRAVEATDEETRAAHLADHARQVRQHIQKLNQKKYWEQFEPSPEFVVLFIAGEAFFSAALQHDPTLLEETVGQNVIVATPTTLITLLRTVSLLWREEKVAESAREVSTLGRDVYQRLSTMGDHMTKLGQKIQGVVGTYNETIGSLERRVFPAARRLADHGAAGTNEIGVLESIDRSVQLPQAPELVEPGSAELAELQKALDAA